MDNTWTGNVAMYLGQVNRGDAGMAPLAPHNQLHADIPLSGKQHNLNMYLCMHSLVSETIL